jgi:uncharacterized protein YkwD
MLRVVVAFALAAFLAGCPAGGNPSWRRDKAPRPARTITFAPSGDPATSYNDPPIAEAPSSRFGDELVLAVTETATAAGRAAPLPDGRLFALAGDLARLIADEPVPPYEAIEFALSHHGVIEPSPHLVTVGAREGQEEAAIRAIRDKLPEVLGAGSYARVGVGIAARADGTSTIVVALLESGIETAPIPRQVAAKGVVAVRGRVLAPYGEPRVYVTQLGGHVERPPVVRDDEGGFRVEIRCGDGAGKRQVEVTAQGPRGVTVLANFPVWCGEAPPARVALSLPAEGTPVATAAEAERAVFELANADRRRAGLPPLTWSDRAAGIARAHCLDMRDNGFVGHVSPTTGSASDRMRAAGLGTPLVLENVARAFSPEEAEAGFMNSPGHRANLMSPEATHIGIGVVLGDDISGRPELYVTQLFYRVPPRLDRKAGLAAARRAIAEKRKAAGVGEVASDRGLDEVAQRLADGLVKAPDRKDELAARAGRELDKFGDRYTEVTTVLTVVGDPADLEPEGVADGQMRAYGLGMAQGDDPSMGENAIFVVIIFARGR